ncbi:MAG: hydrogenase maturation nickel metallochaperone HypA [Myxococcota bacterium]
MHELSLTRNIVSIVDERAAGRKVRAIRLQIGQLAGIEVDAVRFCFDIVAQGTTLEGADLNIDEIPGQGQCLQCDKLVDLEHPILKCPCQQRARLKIVAGEELLIKSMEI